MKTATAALEDSQKAMRENVLQQRIMDFTTRYAPEDKREIAEFHYDLLNIVRAIYTEASENSEKVMMKLSTMVVNPWIPKSPE